MLDLEENRVKGQLVGLLVESGQRCPGLSQQAGVTCTLLLRKQNESSVHMTLLIPPSSGGKNIEIVQLSKRSCNI